ncbi:hypothetical protein J7T55_001899 [Diaporthe amygdali]|uniref:uncharacterized protein n=1 Tax=Phomopsis amygdali TaxID=1214568 RepID=UPI0022FE12D9|nr:uncharacterized protein J7T55_001899 [Diaporthe amygdali]KAJ0117700.1 hypothetical protein J7T55_001899 [Diaporthe amygdali]
MYFVDWTHQSGAILASLQAPLRRRPLSSSALRPASNGPLFAGRRDRRLNKIRIWVDSYCVDVDYVGSLASLGVSSWRPAEVAIGRSSQKERALWEIEDKIRSSVPNRAPRRERSGAQWCKGGNADQRLVWGVALHLPCYALPCPPALHCVSDDGL